MSPTLSGPNVVFTPAPIPPWKRAADITLSLVALPLLPLVALLMFFFTRLVAPGPILFRQDRVGYNGRRFVCLKFRTMRVGASTTGHQGHLQQLISSNSPMEKLDNRGDSRLMPGAWWLRATGLDELPQVLNVLRGEMSLVGPRPCLPYEYEHYLPWQKQRLSTLPGLTGLWQVNGKNRTTFEQMIRIDIHYARHVSPWLDIKIILKTVPALIIQVLQTRQARKAQGGAGAASTAVPARTSGS